MRLLRRLYRDPIVMVLPVLALLWMSWQHYVAASNANLTAASSQQNVLPNGDFEAFDARQLPTEWTVTGHGEARYQPSVAPGHYSKRSFQLDVPSYRSGDVTLASAVVLVSSGQSYFYKGIYKTDAPFDFLVRYIKKDGTSELRQTSHQEAEAAWAAVSTAFKAAPDLSGVQFMYKLSATGHTQFDTTFLQAQPDHITLPTQPAAAANAIPNAKLQSTPGAQVPTGWSSYHYGKMTAAFSYEHTGADKFLRAAVTAYKSGEAKWQYAPQRVTPHGRYTFSAQYRSDVPANVTAEYTLADGSRQFQTLETVPPADEWTHITDTLEAPQGATNLFVSLILRHNGTVDTRQYTLSAIPKPGPLLFNRPLVSITFDDGWESAYENGARLLDRYGYKGTFYLNPAAVDTNGFVDSKQVQDLGHRGHELASHGYEHVDLMGIKQKALQYQLQHAHDYFIKGLNVSAVDLAVPYGKTDARVDAYARQYYASLRTTDAGQNTRQNFDPYHLRVLYVGSDMSEKTLREQLTEAAQNHAWLILVYHRVEPSGASDTLISSAAFEQQLKDIKQSQLPVVTVQAALSELGKQ